MRLKTRNPSEVFQEFFDSVMLFNKTMGNDVNNKDLIPLYRNLLKEEAGEMAEAESAEDELDSIIDQLVVGKYLMSLVGYEEIEPYAPVTDYVDSSEGIAYWCDEEEDEDLGEIYARLEELMGVFLQLSINHKGALMEIANSNMSKFIPVTGALCWEQEEYFDTICVDIEKQGRYTGVSWSRVGDNIVFRDEKGKLMKAPTYWEPNLTQYIY